MKKISHIILAFVVVFATMGMTVSAHYCGDELKSVQLVNKSDSCCGDSCDSCRNEIIKVEVEDDFTTPIINFDFTQDFSFLPAFIYLLIVPTFTDEPVRVRYHKPPPLKIQTVLADLQVYRL